MIVRVTLGENLEYFVKVKNEKKGLTYKRLKSFLERRLKEAPKYLSPCILTGIQAVDLLKDDEYGFPVIGKYLHGAGRHVMLGKNLFLVSFSVIDIYSIRD